MADIVIVEDDEIMGNVVGNALTTRGHTVELVTNGDDAAEVIRNHQPDLVVLDCALPGKPGMVVLKDLRESEMLRDIPVIVISARR
ncbi:MAG: response regulator transcription factor, partial [Sphingomonadaceae bacterium]